MEISDIHLLIGVFKDSGIHEFELEKDGVRVRMVRSLSGGLPAALPSLPQPIAAAPIYVSPPNDGAATQPADSLETATMVKVESPIVGTFYRRPNPDSAPFVKEGDVVTKGATLCIIEAMKLMNEIEAPCSGKAEKILLSDGEVVEFGEVLFCITPDV